MSATTDAIKSRHAELGSASPGNIQTY